MVSIGSVVVVVVVVLVVVRAVVIRGEVTSFCVVIDLEVTA